MKRIITIITSVVLSASLLCSCGFDKATYTAAVKSLNDDITSAGTTLGNYGNFIINYWNNLNRFGGVKPLDTEKAIQYANDFLVEKSDETRDTMDEAYENIKNKFAELPEAKTNDSDIKALDEKIKTAYEDYCDLYETVTTPSGSDVSSYAKSVLDTLSELSDLTGELSDTLSE